MLGLLTTRSYRVAHAMLFIVQVSSSTNDLSLCFVIVPLFTKLYAFLLYGCFYLDFLLCNPIWSTSNRPSSKTQNNSNKAFKTIMNLKTKLARHIWTQNHNIKLIANLLFQQK